MIAELGLDLDVRRSVQYHAGAVFVRLLKFFGRWLSTKTLERLD